MTTSVIDADSLLVVDVGSITTRAMLIDVVDGRYRFLAAGTAPSTAGAPFMDIGEGIRQAIDRLQAVTGRRFVGGDESLIMPTSDSGLGVDAFAATISAGAPLRTVLIGLLEDVSLQSARRLAATTSTGKTEILSLNDRRKTEERIDAVLRLRPDLVIVAGGIDGGASQSVMKLLEALGLACYLMPQEQRPEVLYAGNSELQEAVERAIGDLCSLHFSPNIRPTLEDERLDAAQASLAKISSHIRTKRIAGAADIDAWSKGSLLPSSSAFGRLIRFISKAYTANKGALGVDIGASATTLAAAYRGKLALGVYPDLGLGEHLPEILNSVSLADISRWLVQPVSESYLLEYLHNKSLHPGLVPVTEEDLGIELALARVALQTAVRRLSESFPPGIPGSGGSLLPWFEPVIASGSVLTHAPSMAHSMLALLDGLQPSGIGIIVLDQNHISSGLGAAAAINPELAVQVLDTNTYLYLGTVIAPVGTARPGTPILKVKMTYQNGHEASLEVKQGALEVLPLPLGSTAKLQLQPLHRTDIGVGSPGRGGKLTVQGGVLGVVIDARGRPLLLPEDAQRRGDLHKKWLSTLSA